MVTAAAAAAAVGACRDERCTLDDDDVGDDDGNGAERAAGCSQGHIGRPSVLQANERSPDGGLASNCNSDVDAPLLAEKRPASYISTRAVRERPVV